MGYIRLLPPFSQVGEYEPPISAMTDYTTLLRAAMEQGFPLEPVIGALRERGASIIEAVKAVREVTGLSLAEAKQLVTDSRAWGEPGNNNQC